MSEAYLIVDTIITKPTLYEQYKELAKPLIESFGGEYLVRGGKMFIDQADLWSPSRLVIIKFPSFKQAEAFLASDEYKPIKKIRLESSKATISVVEGV